MHMLTQRKEPAEEPAEEFAEEVAEEAAEEAAEEGNQEAATCIRGVRHPGGREGLNKNRLSLV